VTSAARNLKRLFDFYVFGNLHIAFCALALTLTTQSFLRLSLRHELLVFVFCGTFFGYNLQRLPGVLQHNPIPEEFKRHYWNAQHRVLLGVLSILAGLAFAWSFSLLYLRSQVAALVPAALSFAYAVPVIPTRRKWIELREIAGMKIFVIALTWACSCALLPVASVHHAGTPWLPAGAVAWASVCSMLIFSLTVPFDIRDLRYDAGRLMALPALVGVKTSIVLALAGLLVSDALVWFMWRRLRIGSISQAVAYSVWCVIASAFVYMSSPDRNEYYFSFWIDGLLLLLCGMIWWAAPVQ
jgi:hypothetical protein